MQHEVPFALSPHTGETAMAPSLLLVYGTHARSVTIRHIGRCLDQGLLEEAAFLIRIRNQFDALPLVTSMASDTRQ